MAAVSRRAGTYTATINDYFDICLKYMSDVLDFRCWFLVILIDKNLKIFKNKGATPALEIFRAQTLHCCLKCLNLNEKYVGNMVHAFKLLNGRKIFTPI